MFDNFNIGNPDVLNHQECCCAHNRRHQLAVSGAGDLNGSRFFRFETDFLHQWNRKSTGCDHVGNGRTRDQTG